MQETQPTTNLDQPRTGRKLSDELYDVYYLDHDDQTALFRSLARLVSELGEERGHVLVEGLAPSSYVEDNQIVYTLVVTVSH